MCFTAFVDNFSYLQIMENQNPEKCESAINEDNGDDSGFIDVSFLSMLFSFLPSLVHLQVVYREMCSNHAEAMVDLQVRGVTGSKELLRYFMQERNSLLKMSTQGDVKVS